MTDPLTVDVEVEEVVVEGSTLNITCNARDGNPPVVNDYIWELTSKYTEENLEPILRMYSRRKELRYLGGLSRTCWQIQLHGDKLGWALQDRSFSLHNNSL